MGLLLLPSPRLPEASGVVLLLEPEPRSPGRAGQRSVEGAGLQGYRIREYYVKYITPTM